MQANNITKNTSVHGGTGKTGRRVVERLEVKGLPVRVGSRSGEPPFDWEDRATWPPALRDVESVYIAYYPDLAVSGATSTIRSFVELVVESGVRRLVLLSGRGEQEARLCEQVVRDCGASWTIVRASWFCQNFRENFFLEQVLSGEVALPVGKVAEPCIDAEDVAVAALTEHGHAGQLYEVTGPRLLTFAEAVAEIAEAADGEIRYVPISLEQYKSMLAEFQVPTRFVALLTYLFTEVLDGRNAHLTDGVRRALGRPPRDFTDYARDAAATGVWAV